MFLYLVTNTIDGKRYIGQTRGSLSRRWSGHCANLKRADCRYLAHAIKKHGKENFTIEPLHETNSSELLNELEAEYIIRYCTLAPNGYNLKAGGQVSALHPETKEKLRLARLGKPLSAEHKNNISRGLQNPNVKTRRSLAMKGRVISDETRQKMSESHTGKACPWNSRVWTVEQKQRVSDRVRGRKNPKAKITAEIADQIRSSYETGMYSQTEVAEMFKITQTQVSKIVLGRQWNAVEIQKAS